MAQVRSILFPVPVIWVLITDYNNPLFGEMARPWQGSGRYPGTG